MTNDFRMSYFMPPIAPIKDEHGQLVTPPTLIPCCEVSVEQVFQMITCNENLKVLTEQVRNSEDIRTAKASLLPYVTPCGTFSRRSSKCLIDPSLLTVVDIDYLTSYQEAVEMRKTLFNDPLLHPVLTLPMADDANCITEKMKLAMLYTVMIYGTGTPPPFGEKKKGVDFSGKDIVRSCFLCHDPGALFRATNE